MLSDFWIQLFDLVGAILAEAHAVEEGLVVAQSTRSYVGLIDDLLLGIAPRDAEAQRLCTLCGIRPGAPMATLVNHDQDPDELRRRPCDLHHHREALVLLVLCGSGRLAVEREREPLDLEVTLRSFVRLLEQLLPPATFGKLIDIRNGEVTAIACGDTATARSVLRALRGNGFARRPRNGGTPMAVGVSLDVVDIANLPKSLEEARMALEFAGGKSPIMHFSEIDLLDLLVRGADGAAMRLIPHWAHQFNATNDAHSRELVHTIRVFADCSFNVKRTAQRLGVHTNTVYFRLNRVKTLTGRDPRTYSGTSLILTALRLLEIHASNPA
jgi:hypothetical protein